MGSCAERPPFVRFRCGRGYTTRPSVCNERPQTHAWGSQPEMFGPRHEYRLGIITREVEKLPRGARVLDAAVGLGQLAGRMKQRGYEVIGIDYSFEAAMHVRKTLGIPAVIGDLT